MRDQRASTAMRKAMNLTEEQRQIVDWNNPSKVLNVIAKAGTGKTTTAVELIRTQLNLSHRVLVLTFTRNGTAELASVLDRNNSLFLASMTSSMYVDNDIDLMVATFDTFLRDQLKQLNIPQISWQTVEKTWVIERLYRLAGSDLCEENPRWFNRTNLLSRVKELCSLLELGEPVRASISKTIEPKWKQMAGEAAEEGKLLFGGYSQLVLDNAQRVADLCLLDYDFLIVDESQDTSRHELEVLAKLAGKMPIVCLGDPGQNLMAFRGALGNLSGEFEGLKVPYVSATLSVNRRSTIELVRGQNSLQESNGWSGPLATRASSGKGQKPLTCVAGSEDQLLETLVYILNSVANTSLDSYAQSSTGGFQRFIRDRIELLAEVGVLSETQVPSIDILVPTNHEGSALESALGERGFTIAFLKAHFNPFDTHEAMLLRSWCNPEGEYIWTRIQFVIEAQFRYMRKNTSGRAKTEIEAIHSVLMKSCSRHSGLQVSLTQALEVLVKWTTHLQRDPRVSTTQAHEYLGKLISVYQLWSQSYGQSEIGPMLDGLTYVTRSFNACQRRGNVLDKVRNTEPWIFQEVRRTEIVPSKVSEWIKVRSQAAKMCSASALQVGYPCIKTINRSKGDTVDMSILYRADKIPFEGRVSTLQAPHDREKSNRDKLALAYVAASRARYVHVELALGKVGVYHSPRLAGWEYLDSIY